MCVYAGQSAGIAIIAAGSAGGGLLLLIIAVIISITVCFIFQKHKQKAYSLSTNVSYNKRRVEGSSELHDYDVIDNDIAHKFSQSSVAVELGVIYDTVKESNTDAPKSYEEDFTLNTVHNVAYKSSAVPTSANVAYVQHKSQKGPKTKSNDEYDYI